MIEPPPAGLKKINNLFADTQSTEPVSLPNASGTFSSNKFDKFRATAASKMKALNLALLTSTTSAREKTLDTGSQESPYGLQNISTGKTPTNGKQAVVI